MSYPKLINKSKGEIMEDKKFLFMLRLMKGGLIL